MKTSPTKRTLDLVRKEGFIASVVEKWNAYVKIRQDVFGFGDVLACNPDTGPHRGLWLLQATTVAHHAERRAKILGIKEAQTFLKSGGRIAVVSWDKRGAGRKLWTPRWEEITLDMFSIAGA